MRSIKLSVTASFLFLVFTILSGCAIGNKYDFIEATPSTNISADNKVAVSANDRRRTVVSGECAPNYVGMQRAGFGNPWRVHTLSGNPFTQDVAESIAMSLNDNGFNTKTILIEPPTEDKKTAANILLKSEADRYILVTVNQWESDTYNNIGLRYNLLLKVFNKEGQAIAQNTVDGQENISGSLWNPPAAAKKKIPEAYQRILQELLNDSEVQNALTEGLK